MSHIFFLLLKYKYWILFPLAVVEGPIITIIAGFFTTMGLLNPLAVYITVVIGDLFGDAWCYIVGRYGGALFLGKFGKFFGITPEKIARAKAYFDTNHNRTLVLSKIMHGVGIAGLITAGNLRIPYKKFFKVCTVTSIAQSAILLVIGILFGHAYVVLDKYLNYFATATIVIGVAVVLFFILKSKFKVKKP